MTDGAVKIDAQTRIKLLEIAVQLTVAAIGNNGNIPLIISTFEKCHESVFKKFISEPSQEGK